MEKGFIVFDADSAGVDRRAREYIGELVHELLSEQGIDPCAFGWELVVSWEAEENE
jgi:hypothetical protein